MIKTNLMSLNEKITNLKNRLHIYYDIKIMAVSKMHSAEEIIEAIKCGQILFGENRVLEAFDKFSDERIKKNDFELHIIGHLQRNKAKKAVEISAMIQSIDKMETLNEIEKEASKINKKIEFLIEINTSGEEQKSGINSNELFDFVENITNNNFQYCNLRGLMTVGPLTDDKYKIRESFKMLNKSYIDLKKTLNKSDFDILSMGMSNDFEIAIEEGSNMVRIGSLIFGERKNQ